MGFVVPIFQGMVDEGCQVIVVACNTVTTTLIKQLRERFDVPLVAMEPMVKPAAELTKSQSYSRLRHAYHAGQSALQVAEG